MKNIFTILFISIIASSSFAQITKIDSLRRLISTEKDEKRKTDLLLMLSIEFRQINADSSRMISDKVLKYSEKQNDDLLRIKAELNTVYYFINRSNPDSGFIITEKNINALKRKGSNDSLIAQYESASGYTLMKMNKQKEALR
jgi:hypothetical protein